MILAGREVSGIGLGTAQFAFRERSRSESVATVHAALDAGIRLIDTALAYTQEGVESYAEELVAAALRARPGLNVVVATKGGHLRRGDRFPIDGSPATLRAHCEISLRTLGVERIDLYQLHHVDPAVPLAESVGALADLRAVPAAELQAAADRLPLPISDPGFIWLQAVVDGRILPKSPKAIFLAGQQNKVPLIIGTSAQELDLSGGQAMVYPTLAKAFGGDKFRILSFYHLDLDPNPKPDPVLGTVAMQISTDLMMRCPSQWTAAHMPQAWMYQLDVDTTGGPAHHGSELTFVFNARPAGKTLWQWPPLLDYWANFATTGNPNGAGPQAWPAYGDAGNVIAFTSNGAVVQQGVRKPVCDHRDQP